MLKNERNEWTAWSDGEERERDNNSATAQTLSSMVWRRHKDSRKDFIKMELIYHQKHLCIIEKIFTEERLGIN